MTSVGEYLLSVIAAAIVCSMISALLPGKNAVNAIIKVTSGVLLTVTVVSPIIQLDFTGLTGTITDYFNDGKAIASYGQAICQEDICEIIEGRFVEYINQMADENGVKLNVQIVVDSALLKPTQIVLTGAVSPYVKQKMQNSITKELGISEVNIIWN